MANEIAKKQPKFEELALAKVKEYQEAGMVLPPNFNPTNSLKKARFMLNDMKVNGKPVLEVCTEMSIVQCLLDSVAKGLDFSEGQIWFIPRGNQMTTMESVYGRIVRAKRASKNYKPIVQYVHEGDEFLFGADVDTGATKIFKHTTSLENLDKPIIAAYTYVTDNDGVTEVFIMTKREWLKSWTKSSNGASVAKEFERDMIYRTIIKKSTKSLVNANTNAYFAPVNDDDDAPLAGDRMPEVDEQSGVEEQQTMEFVEAEVVEEPKVVEPTPTPAPSNEFENDEF
jgi:recombination protein RecT